MRIAGSAWRADWRIHQAAVYNMTQPNDSRPRRSNTMPQLTFYRQKRRDGGVRTGIDVDGETLLHEFRDGSEDIDPALQWWADVRCKGARLPTEPSAAREWFLAHAEPIQAGLKTLAAEIRPGVDFDAWPVLWKMPKPPRGTQITIACCASQRLPARKIAAMLAELADTWRETIQGLPEAAAFLR